MFEVEARAAAEAELDAIDYAAGLDLYEQTEPGVNRARVMATRWAWTSVTTFVGGLIIMAFGLLEPSPSPSMLMLGSAMSGLPAVLARAA